MRKIQWLMLAAVLTAGPVFADEGMWTFDNFPSAAVAKKYGTQIDARWLDKVRASIVRLSNCTASFVSAQGLLLTNHHCVEDCLAQLGSKEKSYVEDGFLAKSRDEEKKSAYLP